MLCPRCEEGVNTYMGPISLYDSLQSLQLSAQKGCYICRRMLDTAADRQIVIDFSSVQSSTGSSSLPKESEVEVDFYGIRAYPWAGSVRFECRSGGAKHILLELSCKSWITYTDPNTSTTASEECFSLIQQWIDECVENHEECIRDTESAATKPLPTRLVQVQPQIRLVEGKKMPKGTRYVALSHCWGLKPIFSLKESVLKDLFESIPAARLPQNFQDAIQLAQKLGIDYIWIDSLCIIQDSQNDWLHESSKMKNVYANCWCNLAATGFPDGEKGIFAQRDPSFVFKPIPNPREPNDILFDDTHWINGVETAPLNQRAWVLQERLFSPRTIHFGREQLFWECRSKMLSETFPQSIPHMKFFLDSHRGAKGSVLQRMKDEWGEVARLEIWFKIVAHYNTLNLTKQQDRLVALSGIAQEARNILCSDYRAGLWESSSFLLQLCWRVEYESYDEFYKMSFRRSVYCAPSWSWASITGAARFPVHYDVRKTYAKVDEVRVEPLGSDSTGTLKSAFLRIRGPLRIAQISSQSPSLKWQIGGPREQRVKLDGIDLKARGYADAFLPNSNIMDLGPGPFDLESSLASEQTTPTQEPFADNITIYLFGVLSSLGLQLCLWLRPTGRASDEFQRVGHFHIWEDAESGISEFDLRDNLEGSHSTITII